MPAQDSEVVIDTTNTTPEEAAQEILLYLRKQGYVGDVAETI
jgi:adenylylsulfate kinase-like enzyme